MKIGSNTIFLSFFMPVMILFLLSVNQKSMDVMAQEIEKKFANKSKNILAEVENQLKENPTSSFFEINLSCKKLIRTDIKSGSDPFIKIMRKYVGSDEWEELGQTEIIQNNQNPNFTMPLLVQWNFERPSVYRLEVWDYDQHKKNNDFLGNVYLNDAEFSTALGGKLEKEIRHQNHSHAGSMVLMASPVTEESLVGPQVYLSFNLKAAQLPSTDGFLGGGKADPYVEFCTDEKTCGGNSQVIQKTNVIKNNLNPDFQRVNLHLNKFPQGKIKMKIWDEESNGKHKFIGESFIDTALLRDSSNVTVPLQMSEKYAKAKSTLQIENSSSRTVPTKKRETSFVEYLQNGCELGLCLGIDFTSSNEHQFDPKKSLHYSGPGVNDYSQYERAIWGLGEFLFHYDKDHLYPTYGFGAKVDGVVDHCFPINKVSSRSGLKDGLLYPMTDEIHGMGNVIAHLKKTKTSINFFGPTNFTPLITKATQEAQKVSSQNKYNILIILTDGEITDMDSTLEAIKLSEQTPLSIIIIGIGENNFSSMKILDGDDQESKSTAKRRDNVQFVKLNKYFPQEGSFDAEEIQRRMSQFTREVMAELPTQVVKYFSIKGN